MRVNDKGEIFTLGVAAAPRIERRTYATVFQRRPCHFSNSKPACRACARFCGRLWRRGAGRGRRRRLAVEFLYLLLFSSRTLLQDSWLVVRIIIHGPLVGQKTVNILEVQPTASEAPDNIDSRHIVAALFDSRSDAAQGETFGW